LLGMEARGEPCVRWGAGSAVVAAVSGGVVVGGSVFGGGKVDAWRRRLRCVRVENLKNRVGVERKRLRSAARRWRAECGIRTAPDGVRERRGRGRLRHVG
jgi:hypothetical protein